MSNIKTVSSPIDSMLIGYQNKMLITIKSDFSYTVNFIDGARKRRMKFILDEQQINYLEKFLSHIDLRWNNFHQTFELGIRMRKAIGAIEKKKREIAQPLYRNQVSIICRACKHINDEGRDICNLISCKFTHKGYPCHHGSYVADGEKCDAVERNALKKLGLYEEQPVKRRIKPFERPVSQVCFPCNHENIAEEKYCWKLDCKFTHLDQDCHHGFKVANGYECKTMTNRALRKANVSVKPVIDPKARPVPKLCYPCKHKGMCKNSDCKFVHPKQRCKHKNAVSDGQLCNNVF